ncbi:hypothetical protein IMG5_150270 [Ichthyophthirius multifiliis]|uniref:Transmembrane protein n=1 Tax=Ichthyophthirius multifiliis TaxID=5932 RepID=G0QYK2_ICHMU|nr:hypothetical protein IMG5_150270 [Ichthyophthirius multifiliis]EGR29709.1 hypothetical protein IMG5_150270 [Ichthyophthirius multifiliis]|eukprot:XP_004030945.1 hypothetical protein IMG5_150270 [Ichthyophthirius multifiliis]
MFQKNRSCKRIKHFQQLKYDQRQLDYFKQKNKFAYLIQYKTKKFKIKTKKAIIIIIKFIVYKLCMNLLFQMTFKQMIYKRLLVDMNIILIVIVQHFLIVLLWILLVYNRIKIDINGFFRNF